MNKKLSRKSTTKSNASSKSGQEDSLKMAFEDHNLASLNEDEVVKTLVRKLKNLQKEKENLQITNDELTTANLSLKNQIDKTEIINSDLHNLFSETGIITILLDKDIKIIHFTHSAEKLFNITANDIGRPLEHFTNKLNYENLIEDALQVVKKNAPIEHEVTDKSDHLFLARFFPYAKPDEQISGVVLNFIDVTDSKEKLETLRDLIIQNKIDPLFIENLQISEEKYRTLVEGIDDGFALIELIFDEDQNAVDFTFQEANASFVKQMGSDPVGKKATEVFPKTYQLLVNSYGNLVQTDDSRIEQFFIPELGNQWFQSTASQIKKTDCNQIALFYRNITDSKYFEQNQEILREITEELDLFNDVTKTLERISEKLANYFKVKWCILIELNKETRNYHIQGWNSQNVTSLNGIDRIEDYLFSQKNLGKKVDELLVVNDIKTDFQTNTAIFEEFGIQSFIIVPLGCNGHCDFQLSIIDDKTREWRADEIKIFQQIAERIWVRLEHIRAEVSLNESEEHFRALVNQNLAGIFEIDLNGKIIFANNEFCKMLGYEHEELMKLNVPDFVYKEDISLSIEKLKQLQIDHTPFEMEKRYVKKDGSLMWVHNSISPIISFDKNINSAVIVSLDITERKTAQEAIRSSEEKYRTLFDSIDAGFCTIEVIFDENDKPLDYRFLSVNPAFIKHTGLKDAVGKTIREFVSNHEEFWFETYGRIAKTGIAERFENEAVALGKYYEVYAFRIGQIGQNRVAIIFNDIAERKRIEELMRESKEQLQLIIESTNDYAIITFDLRGFITSWNRGAEHIFGYSEREVLDRYCSFLFTPEDQKNGIPEHEMSVAIEKGRAEDERWHVNKNGSHFIMSGVMHPLKDGKVKGFVKIARDLTEWLKAENAVREKEMLQKLILVQEEERKRIARNLHDEFGQQLTALRIKLDTLKNGSQDSVFLSQINEIQGMAKKIDEGIDFIAWELRPSVLDDVSLVAALETYIKQWSNFSGIKTELTVSRLKRAILSQEAETCLYRVVQEALNNIHKHTKATYVEIVLKKRNDLLILIVADNGKGFRQKSKTILKKGIGLTGMKERIALVGGTLEIESELKKGTTIYVRIPLQL